MPSRTASWTLSIRVGSVPADRAAPKASSLREVARVSTASAKAAMAVALVRVALVWNIGLPPSGRVSIPGGMSTESDWAGVGHIGRPPHSAGRPLPIRAGRVLARRREFLFLGRCAAHLPPDRDDRDGLGEARCLDLARLEPDVAAIERGHALGADQDLVRAGGSRDPSRLVDTPTLDGIPLASHGRGMQRDPQAGREALAAAVLGERSLDGYRAVQAGDDVGKHEEE